MGVKKKAKPVVSVPRSYKAAVALMQRYAETLTDLAKLEAELERRILPIKARVAGDCLPLVNRLALIEARLSAYADEHRADLTDHNKVKFHQMPAGRMGWRSNPPSVKWAKGLNGDHIVANVKAMLGQAEGEITQAKTLEEGAGAVTRLAVFASFIRTKEEPNKEAMGDNRDLALKVEGVRIGSSGETFYIDTTAVALPDAVLP